MAAAPLLTCVLLVETELKGWQKTLDKITQGIEGLAFSIDAADWWINGEHGPMMSTKKLMFLQGQVDPMIFIKKMYKARTYAMIYRIDYGHEENPEGTRKPNQHFTKFNFEINVLEEDWCKKIIGALKTIQGVSFTIHAPQRQQMGYSDAQSQKVFMCGNIEKGVLMKMYAKTGIQMMAVEYGRSPPKKSEDGTEIKPTKDT